MIDVRMREHHRIKLTRLKGKMLIALNRLATTPLIEPAIEKHFGLCTLHQMHRTRDRLSRTEKVNAHALA